MSDFRWLDETRALQREAFGVDPWSLDGELLADYVTWNVAALTAEVGEFLNEVAWKPWSTDRGPGNRDAAVSELIDVAHFLANLACVLQCTDEEWERKYHEKMSINRKRQADGYDNSNKCNKCKRALDDASVRCTQTLCMEDE